MLADAHNLLQFSSENVVRVYGLCIDLKDNYLIVMENMKLGSLRNVRMLDEIQRKLCFSFALAVIFIIRLFSISAFRIPEVYSIAQIFGF